jgi:anti-anti-sigma regulatory factor
LQTAARLRFATIRSRELHHINSRKLFSGNVLTETAHTGAILPLIAGVDHVQVQAPPSLNAATRAAFYEHALEALARLDAAGSPGRLIVDMRGTDRVDSSGLSTLVLIQVRAAERKHTVGLRGLSEEIRFLLLMTRLEDRFDIDPSE